MTSESNQKSESNTKDSKEVGLWAAFFVGLALLIISILLANAASLSGWQARVFYNINNLSGSYKTIALWATEGLGAGYPIAICVLVPLLFKKYRLAWRFFFTAAAALVSGFAVKYIVNEPRPIVLLHDQLYVRAIETGPGFPSGHMLAATALALTLWFILPVRWRWLSVLWIVVVAWSRLYLGVHTPADILSGFAIGLMAVCAVRLLPSSIAKPLKLNEE